MQLPENLWSSVPAPTGAGNFTIGLRANVALAYQGAVNILCEKRLLVPQAFSELGTDQRDVLEFLLASVEDWELVTERFEDELDEDPTTASLRESEDGPGDEVTLVAVPLPLWLRVGSYLHLLSWARQDEEQIRQVGRDFLPLLRSIADEDLEACWRIASASHPRDALGAVADFVTGAGC